MNGFRRWFCGLGLWASMGWASAGAGGPPLAVVPERVELRGNFDRVQFLVREPGDAPDHAADLTHEAEFATTDPSVATFDGHGRLLAVGNGTTAVTARAGARSVQVPVVVRELLDQPVVDFAAQVLPILSKRGCNAGACHASQYGKGGFKLSVFGFEPASDAAEVLRPWMSRRVNRIEPERSLLLRKPTLDLPHGGGRKLVRGSVDYRVLSAWIAAGCAGPKADSPTVTGIDVFPPRRAASESFRQQLRVVASWSDGSQRDVTAWAKYDSMDEAVASVSADGLVHVTGKGQAPIMIRFGGQAEVAMVVTPFESSAPLAGFVESNFVDRWAAEKFRQLGIRPSPLCDDATFIRRAYLDAIGTLPSPQPVVAFLEDKNPAKRAALVDELLGMTGDPARDVHNNAYAAFWALRWSDLIRSSSRELGDQGMWAMYNWIKGSFRDNKPFDQFVRELVTAQGSIYMNGPANYYRIATNPADLCEVTAQLFLGVRLQCAKCHHHPFEAYGQDEYYGMAAFFARVGTKNSQEFGLFGRESVVMVRSTGSVSNPRTGRVIKPTPLGGEPIEDPLDPRRALAAWLTSRENLFFSRNIANRYVKYLLGRGLVEPVDDLRTTNPPTNPELLDALANDLAKHAFDTKHLVRTIMNSTLYQLSSQPTEQNAGDSKFYSHYLVKRLPAEVLLDAVDMATATQTKYPNLPQGTRAIELPDAEYDNYFLATFGKPRRVVNCECERVADPNLSQMLHVLNGDVVSGKVADAKGRVGRLLAAKIPDERIVEELYLCTLSRRPSAEEKAAAARLMSQSPSRKEFYEDLLWALMSSKDFLFIR